ncbi:hypothetical protein Tco_0104634 [Tanacetum coccineum]
MRKERTTNPSLCVEKGIYSALAILGRLRSGYASIVAATNPKFISNCGERQTDGDELLAYRPAQQRASYEDLRATILKRLLSMVCHLQNNGVAVRMGQKDAYVL